MKIDPKRADAFLKRVIPFRFLTTAQREALVADMTLVEYGARDDIILQGDETDKNLFLLESGQVEIYDNRGADERRVMLVEPDHFFGEWEALFDVPRFFGIRATERSRCYMVPGDRFLLLVGDVRPFAQSLGVILRDQHGIFAAFERFKVELMRGIGKGYITLAQLLPLYRELLPAMHPLVNSEKLDTTALSYVIRRLPRNVTRTFAYVLTDEIPAVYRDPDGLFPKVPTEARRRDVWETLPGSNLVLLRNGLSDLVDLISCLCLYAVEAKKLRARLRDPGAVRVLKEWANGRSDEKAAMRALPLERPEIDGLRKLWGVDLPARLYEIVKHRETFAITVRRHSEKYNSHRTEVWTHQLAAACAELLGSDPSDLDPDYPVHIVSSNTHSVTNCLNAWYTENGETMVEWAKSVDHPLVSSHWREPYDMVYGVARDYFIAHPEAADSIRSAERDQGILRLKETTSTGIQVQLIDIARVCRGAIDPGIGHGGAAGCADDTDPGEKGLIVNIDYAFGQQAEHILLNLLLLFGSNVRSVSLLGKAGGLLGKRGDILVPTGFLEQSGDHYYTMPYRFRRTITETAAALQDRLPGGDVHTGPMLTVDGTLLQNRVMLRYYRYIWRCIGMEMEGAYYFRQFQEAENIELISRDIPVGFYYYVSDVPLEMDSGLATRLHPSEGIPPLYAITRHVLSSIIQR
jgi:Family of unknown function (DUF6909)/Cyclic nucleotide-binding domain